MVQDINSCNCVGYYADPEVFFLFHRNGEQFFTLSGMAVEQPKTWRDCTPSEAQRMLDDSGSVLI